MKSTSFFLWQGLISPCHKFIRSELCPDVAKAMKIAASGHQLNLYLKFKGKL
ncbi:MAG: hypothetical protein HN978_19095 [Desulfobacula sp.]|jgi:hypothetical protein|nr:hypothetical protein [Desulfobacula sp.]MBT7051759.1 hypothetical protein [Desulfobacula sp.]